LSDSLIVPLARHWCADNGLLTFNIRDLSA
jgi:hypothetical protein